MGTPHGCTTKPCPICGDTKIRGKEQPLCRDCQSIFNTGKKTIEYQTQQSEIKVRHTNSTYLTSRPYIHDDRADIIRSILNNRLEKAWGALTMSILKPSDQEYSGVPDLVTDKNYFRQNGGCFCLHCGLKGDFSGEVFAVNSNIRNALNEFDFVIRLCLEYLHLSGYISGLDILARLNEGLMSTNNYEEKISNTKKRLQEIKYLVENIDPLKE